MTEQNLSAYYNLSKNNHRAAADMLMLLLMPLVFILLLRFPGKYGNYVTTFCYFVPQVFYILLGFFTLVPSRTARRRKIKASLFRAVIVFAIVVILNAIFSVLFISFTTEIGNIFDGESAVRRAIINFLVFNVWPLPVGQGVWFIHSLVYAYLFFMLIEKLRLSRFYVPILIVLSLIALAVGEFAAFFGFPHLGYNYIPGGALTRAIPYMIIGMLIRKYVDLLPKIPRYLYLLTFFAGMFFAAIEIGLLKYVGKLVYYGHTIGFGIMAISLCCFTLSKPLKKANYLSAHGRNYSRRMYILCQPVSLICCMITLMYIPQYYEIIENYKSVISFALSLAFVLIVSLIKYLVIKNRKNKYRHKTKNKLLIKIVKTYKNFTS